MLFNSLHFLVFFTFVTILFFRLKRQRARIWMLLLSSCYFYMTFVPVYILILFATIAIDYTAGLLIGKAQGKQRKMLLAASIFANAGILIYYKYLNFFLSNLAPALQLIVPHYSIPYIDIILPIGLSFHTFQSMSYVIEVYRNNQKPERDFITYSLYVMYYPQLVAGPIERPQNMLHQFHEFKPYNFDNVKEGLSRMAWGFFKKVVIADRAAIVVDHAFSNQDHLSSGSLIIAAMLYSIQIYGDFSGYSDIAIGASRIMGIQLMENFNQPYLAKNITEFWARWHISLSTWFRDYVYIPLGGNRVGAVRRRVNVFVVFLLSGLWHGANWTFIAWGGMHGTLVTLSGGKKRPDQPNVFVNAFRVILTFLLATICWVFFRAPSLSAAGDYLSNCISGPGGALDLGMSISGLLFVTALIVVMFLREKRGTNFLIRNNALFYSYLAGMALVCYFLGVFSENQFIYFQF